MDPNYPMKTLNPNSEKVGVSWSEGLSYTVIFCGKSSILLRAFFGCSRTEFLFFRGKSENIMISRNEGRILICSE